MLLRRRGFLAAGNTLLAAGLGFVWSGCASTKTYHVNVDAAYSPNAISGWSYTMAPSVRAGAASDPRRSQVAAMVEQTLIHRGMFAAPDPADADYVIDFDYGERAEQSKVRTVEQPVMVQPTTGVGSSVIPPVGGVPTRTGPYSSSGPQMVMVPTVEVVRTSEKYVLITARDNPRPVPGSRTTRPPAEAWRVEAVVDDEGTDVQEYLPAMLDAVTEYIGANTGGPVKVVVKR